LWVCQSHCKVYICSATSYSSIYHVTEGGEALHGPMNTKWYAIYTRPRWEKKVNALLTEKGIESYCPLNKVRRRWSDRIKIIEEPLFKSYVFVKIPEVERSNVRMTLGVVNFVYWDGKPAIIKEKEIQVIRRFLNEYEDVILQKIELHPEQRIKITSGPMMDHEGKVLEIKNKTAKVCIDSLGYMLIAYIDKNKLIPIQQTNQHS
jgi:transcription antitermination factor NusG